MPEKEKTSEETTAKLSDLYELSDRLRKQYRDLERKFLILIAYLADKKFIGDEMAKSFRESKGIDQNELLQWFLSKKSKKGST